MRTSQQSETLICGTSLILWRSCLSS